MRKAAKIAGNLAQVPDGVATDGVVHFLPDVHIARPPRNRFARADWQCKLDTGEVLVLARATSVIDAVNTIIYRSLIWGLTLTIIPGLIGGLWLARGPLRRIRTLGKGCATHHARRFASAPAGVRAS